MKNLSTENYTLKEIIVSQSEQIHELKKTVNIHYENFIDCQSDVSKYQKEQNLLSKENDDLKEKIQNSKKVYTEMNKTIFDLDEELEELKFQIKNNEVHND